QRADRDPVAADDSGRESSGSDATTAAKHGRKACKPLVVVMKRVCRLAHLPGLAHSRWRHAATSSDRDEPVTARMRKGSLVTARSGGRVLGTATRPDRRHASRRSSSVQAMAYTMATNRHITPKPGQGWRVWAAVWTLVSWPPAWVGQNSLTGFRHESGS